MQFSRANESGADDPEEPRGRLLNLHESAPRATAGYGRLNSAPELASSRQGPKAGFYRLPACDFLFTWLALIGNEVYT